MSGFIHVNDINLDITFTKYLPDVHSIVVICLEIKLHVPGWYSIYAVIYSTFADLGSNTCPVRNFKVVAYPLLFKLYQGQPKGCLF